MGFNFKISESEIIGGVLIIRPSISEDLRGNIWTSYTVADISPLLPEGVKFVHDKFSESKRNVLRGIHGDEKSWKLVTCVHGKIYQVVVDCRPESPTFKRYQSFEISNENQISVLIPPRMGNAYYVNSERAVYHYKLAYSGEYLDAEEQFSYKWNDPSFGIEWPTNKPILSKRDREI